MEIEVPYKFISENDKEIEETSGTECLYLHKLTMKMILCTMEGMVIKTNIK